MVEWCSRQGLDLTEVSFKIDAGRELMFGGTKNCCWFCVPVDMVTRFTSDLVSSQSAGHVKILCEV